MVDARVDDAMGPSKFFTPIGLARGRHVGGGGVFDTRTDPEIVQYDYDSVSSDGSPCISALDSEMGAQRPELIESSRAAVSQKRSSPQRPQRSTFNRSAHLFSTNYAPSFLAYCD